MRYSGLRLMLKEITNSLTSLPLIFQFFIGCLLLSVLLITGTQEVLFAAVFLGPVMIYIALYHLEWLFYLLVFTIPISVNIDITHALTTDFPDELIMWVIFPAVVFLILDKPYLLPARFWNTPIITLFTLLFIWSIITTIFSTSLIPSVKYVLAKSWYIASFVILAFLVFRDIISIFKTFKVFMFSFTLFLLYSFYMQYLTGFDFEEINNSVMPLYRNHVNFSATLALLVPLVTFWLVQEKTPWKKLIVALYLLTILVGLYFSYGRAAWLSVVVATLVIPIIKYRLIKPVVILSYIIIAFSVFWIIDEDRYLNYRPNFEKTYMRDNIADHIAATFQGSDVSSMERVHRWVASVRMAKERPILGVGPNNYYDHYREYVVNGFRTWVSRNMEKSTSHNYFFIMLTEQGFVAMILYAILIFASLGYAQRLYFRSQNRNYRRIVLTIASCLTAFYVNNFLSELIETDEMGSLFYLLSVTLVVLDLYQDRFEEMYPDTQVSEQKL